MLEDILTESSLEHILPQTLLLLQSLPCLTNSTQLLTNLLRTLDQDGYNRHGFNDQQHDYVHHNSYSEAQRYINQTPADIHNAPHRRRLSGNSSDSNFATDISMVFVCIVCAGFASGLTQGLLSLDFTEMTIKMRSGTPDERLQAARVLPIISRHHLLLVSLMLWNAAATEALPIFLSGLVPEYLAIIISVTLVLFCGEIIPAAILTGPNQLMIAANLVPMVYVVFLVFYPIAYPISVGLDYFLGKNMINLLPFLHMYMIFYFFNFTFILILFIFIFYMISFKFVRFISLFSYFVVEKLFLFIYRLNYLINCLNNCLCIC